MFLSKWYYLDIQQNNENCLITRQLIYSIDSVSTLGEFLTRAGGHRGRSYPGDHPSCVLTSLPEDSLNIRTVAGYSSTPSQTMKIK